MVEFVQDDDRLREERKKAKKNRDKYIGVSSESMGDFRYGESCSQKWFPPFSLSHSYSVTHSHPNAQQGLTLSWMCYDWRVVYHVWFHVILGLLSSPILSSSQGVCFARWVNSGFIFLASNNPIVLTTWLHTFEIFDVTELMYLLN